jgi:hypothetical protein
MDEDGAAAAGNARPGVMVDFDDEIVQGIVAAEPVARFLGRAREGPVIAAVGRVLAPGVAGTDAANRQRRAWPR